jgi:hypothetical protein
LRSRHDAIRLAAFRAGRAIRPKFRFEIFPRCLNIREKFEELEGANCASAYLVLLTDVIIQQGLLLCQAQNEIKRGDKNEGFD